MKIKSISDIKVSIHKTKSKKVFLNFKIQIFLEWELKKYENLAMVASVLENLANSQVFI